MAGIVKPQRTQMRRVLAALASVEECDALKQILGGDNWELSFTPTFEDTIARVESSGFGVVLCAKHFRDGHCWKDVLSVAQRIPVAPQIIVADRLADQALWAEVLNLGCYDLIMTPFRAEEVLRVVQMSWEFHERELARTAVRRIAPKAEELWRRPPGRALAGDVG